VARHVMQQLQAWDVPFVYGLVGDSIIPLLEALRVEKKPQYIAVRNEEAGAFMASAYGKLTGDVGVCMAEAGPATMHLLNGLYDAYFDRVPVLALTGQVAQNQEGTHWPQAVNPALSYEEAAVFNHTIACPGQVPELLNTAYRRAFYRGGVSRLTIPMDVQASELTTGFIYPPPKEPVHPPVDAVELQEAVSVLNGASRSGRPSFTLCQP